MNQDKIGKFIAKCRKEKELTQQELAKRLNVTDKAVSKWENGRCLPDVSLYLPLCKELDISINDLLSAKKIDEKDYKDSVEENIINTLKQSNEEIKKKNKRIKWIIISLIFGFFCVLCEITRERYNDIAYLNTDEYINSTKSYYYSEDYINYHERAIKDFFESDFTESEINSFAKFIAYDSLIDVNDTDKFQLNNSIEDNYNEKNYTKYLNSIKDFINEKIESDKYINNYKDFAKTIATYKFEDDMTKTIDEKVLNFEDDIETFIIYFIVSIGLAIAFYYAICNKYENIKKYILTFFALFFSLFILQIILYYLLELLFLIVNNCDKIFKYAHVTIASFADPFDFLFASIILCGVCILINLLINSKRIFKHLKKA